MGKCPNCGYERVIKAGIKPKSYGYAKLQHDLHKLVAKYRPREIEGEWDYDHMSLADDILRELEKLLDGGE